jgi:hypothetical protein
MVTHGTFFLDKQVACSWKLFQHNGVKAGVSYRCKAWQEIFLKPILNKSDFILPW